MHAYLAQSEVLLTKRLTPLVKKALSLPERRDGRIQREYNEDEIDVCIWWLTRSITDKQAAHALDLKRPQHTAGAVALAIRQWIGKGRLAVIWKSDKEAYMEEKK